MLLASQLPAAVVASQVPKGAVGQEQGVSPEIRSQAGVSMHPGSTPAPRKTLHREGVHKHLLSELLI